MSFPERVSSWWRRKFGPKISSNHVLAPRPYNPGEGYSARYGPKPGDDINAQMKKKPFPRLNPSISNISNLPSRRHLGPDGITTSNGVAPTGNVLRNNVKEQNFLKRIEAIIHNSLLVDNPVPIRLVTYENILITHDVHNLGRVIINETLKAAQDETNRLNRLSRGIFPPVTEIPSDSPIFNRITKPTTRSINSIRKAYIYYIRNRSTRKNAMKKAMKLENNLKGNIDGFIAEAYTDEEAKEVIINAYNELIALSIMFTIYRNLISSFLYRSPRIYTNKNLPRYNKVAVLREEILSARFRDKVGAAIFVLITTGVAVATPYIGVPLFMCGLSVAIVTRGIVATHHYNTSKREKNNLLEITDEIARIIMNPQNKIPITDPSIIPHLKTWGVDRDVLISILTPHREKDAEADGDGDGDGNRARRTETDAAAKEAADIILQNPAENLLWFHNKLPPPARARAAPHLQTNRPPSNMPPPPIEVYGNLLGIDTESPPPSNKGPSQLNQNLAGIFPPKTRQHLPENPFNLFDGGRRRTRIKCTRKRKTSESYWAGVEDRKRL